MRATGLVLAGLLALVNAIALPEPAAAAASSPSFSSSSSSSLARDLEARAPNCPDVWKLVNADLNALFLEGGKCNALARGAIRALFHDCGSWDQSQGLSGGCDGSLIAGVAPDVELDRIENRGLQNIAGALSDLAGKHNTTKADMIIFAGSESRSLRGFWQLEPLNL